MESAHELGLALPGAAQVTQYINALIGRGLSELDSSAVYLVQEGTSGLGRKD
jgi:3-hydroxyisobutyrate dehydrogenase-like beta-hydroxyacid dehydrogenase